MITAARSINFDATVAEAHELARPSMLQCTFGADGRIRSISPRLSEYFHQHPDNLIYRPFIELIDPADRPLFQIELEMVQPGSPVQIEARCNGAGESRVTLLWDVVCVDRNGGYFVATAGDITPLRDKIEQLQRRNAADTLQNELWILSSGILQLEALFANVAGVIRSRLNVQAIGIWTPGSEASGPKLDAVSAESPLGADAAAILRAMESSVREVIETKTPQVYVRDDESNPPDAADPLVVRGIRFISVLPVLAFGDVVAAVALIARAAPDASAQFAFECGCGVVGKVCEKLKQNDQVQKDLREYWNLLKSIPHAVVDLDPSGRITAWNPAATRLFGWRESAVLGHLLPMVPKSEIKTYEQLLCTALIPSEPLRVETWARSLGGKVFPVAVHVMPLCESWQGIAGRRLLIEDLSVHRRSFQYLRLNHTVSAILRDAQSSEEVIPLLLSVICTQFNWVRGEYWSRCSKSGSWTLVTSWQELSSGTASMDDLLRTQEIGSVEALLGQSCATGTAAPVRFDSESISPAARQIALRHNLLGGIGFRTVEESQEQGLFRFLHRSFDDPDPQLLGCLESVAEQFGSFQARMGAEEARRKADQTALQTQKMDAIGRLAGSMAHDFNNLLTVILGHAELALEHSPQENDLFSELLADIVDAAKRAAGVTRQLLAFSRKQATNPKQVEINEAVTAASAMLRRLIGVDIELRQVLEPNAGHILIDPVQFEQVLLNLVVNAKDAMPNGGVITISTSQSPAADPVKRDAAEAEFVRISVSDTGCGIEESIRSSIFEPFFTTKPVGQGTGMGLSTVYGIVQQCGGQISIESEVGKGTTFHLFFPRIVVGMAPIPADSVPEQIPRGSETIVVVDDESRVARLVERVLTLQGYSVFTFNKPGDALAFLGDVAQSVDLLLTDIVMPAMNGHELASAVRRIRPELPILFMSAYHGSHAESTDAAMEIPCLQKPFTTYSLAKGVRDVLETHRWGAVHP